MAKPRSKSEFVLFNVVYEDGTQRSNRRVPADMLGTGIDDDDIVARSVIEEQDREIAEKSGQAALAIDRLWRVGAREPKANMRERA